jgi:hypothetical protein
VLGAAGCWRGWETLSDAEPHGQPRAPRHTALHCAALRCTARRPTDGCRLFLPRSFVLRLAPCQPSSASALALALGLSVGDPNLGPWAHCPWPVWPWLYLWPCLWLYNFGFGFGCPRRMDRRFLVHCFLFPVSRLPSSSSVSSSCFQFPSQTSRDTNSMFPHRRCLRLPRDCRICC